MFYLMPVHNEVILPPPPPQKKKIPPPQISVICVVCVCVLGGGGGDEMSVSLCFCKRLRALTRWGDINNLLLLLLRQIRKCHSNSNLSRTYEHENKHLEGNLASVITLQRSLLTCSVHGGS